MSGYDTEVVTLPASWPVLPACRDEQDQVFLVLMQVSQADALVSGDADILALRDAFSGRIWTTDELSNRLAL